MVTILYLNVICIAIKKFKYLQNKNILVLCPSYTNIEKKSNI